MTFDQMITWEAAVEQLKRRPESAELVRACFYDDPLLGAAERYWKSTEWRAVRNHLPTRPGTALDIGAGRGISAYALARDGWKVTALEPDPSATVGAAAIRSLAVASAETIDVVETWGEDLPFRDASFDLVHCRQVLHHARDLKQLCCQIGRVLKPGGTFVASREHVISRKDDLPRFLESHPLQALYGGENAYLLQEYTDAIQLGAVRLKHVLNPMASDINLYPSSLAEVKARWARKLRLPSASWIPDALLSLWGARSQTPGRLYTFIGIKVSSHG
jgi:SAM-dependent methyltransferase